MRTAARARPACPVPEYLLTIRIEVDGVDDPEARKNVLDLVQELELKRIHPDRVRVKLQRIHPKQPPRKVALDIHAER